MASRGYSAGRGGGRGAYYKEKYGNRGRGKPYGASPAAASHPPSTSGARTSDELLDVLRRIDGRPYPAYNDLLGAWSFAAQGFELLFDRLQSDPYAPPSHVRLRVAGGAAGFPPELHSNSAWRTAFCDLLARRVWDHVRAAKLDRAAGGGGWAGAKGGDLGFEMPGQQVLERSSVVLLGAPETGTVEVRMTANLPAQGRTILGRQAEELLTKALPRLVRSALTYSTVEDKKAMADFVDSVEAQRDLRRQIVAAGLVAFVPDGAILPRASGASDLPLADGAVGFRSPPSLRRTFSVGPNNLSVSGMGLARGITLIVGGGYHGKSTLLQAIQAGVYDHVPGDGREFAVSDPTLFPVQSEDGRSVTGVNISPFIDNLPFGRSTKSFSTADASGSTSMAASIQEALELGCSALAVDEDTAATNFLIRDARMRMLVGKGQEPITPLISRARALRDEKGVSTILVIGGCGDYLDVADCVVQMQEYRAVDVTARAREIAAAVPVSLDADGGSAYGPVDHRRLAIPSQNPGSDEDRVLKGSKTRVRGVRELSFCGQDVDVSALTQLAETAQTRLVAEALRYLRDAPQFAGLTVRQAVDALERELDARGTDVLSPWGHPTGNMARCRAIEVAAALNRLRGLVVW